MVIGFAHQGPEQVFGRLLKTVDPKRIHILKAGDVPPSSKKIDHLIMFSFADFEENAALLRVMKYKIYVFGSAFDLGRWGIAPADEDVDSIMDVDFDQGIRVPKKPIGGSLTERVLDIVQQYSLFGDLMSHIYDLPSRVAQKPATTACCQWLTGKDKDLTELRKTLAGITKSKQHVLDGIMEVMQRPIALRLQKALNDVAKGMSVEDAARKNSVRPFEIGFVNGSLDRKADVTDIYVQNTGEE